MEIWFQCSPVCVSKPAEMNKWVMNPDSILYLYSKLQYEISLQLNLVYRGQSGLWFLVEWHERLTQWFETKHRWRDPCGTRIRPTSVTVASRVMAEMGRVRFCVRTARGFA